VALPDGPKGDLLCATFVSTQTGWISGTKGRILFTEDGGRNWTSARSGTFLPLNGISFADELNGMAVGPEGTVLLTNNGGRTWTKLPAVSDATLVGVKFLNRKLQWVVGHNGAVLRCDW
jgi:photosystem II stability/assembly factor-like uncharacterized protein